MLALLPKLQSLCRGVTEVFGGRSLPTFLKVSHLEQSLLYYFSASPQSKFAFVGFQSKGFGLVKSIGRDWNRLLSKVLQTKSTNLLGLHSDTSSSTTDSPLHSAADTLHLLSHHRVAQCTPRRFDAECGTRVRCAVKSKKE